jgi:hypothetical protein
MPARNMTDALKHPHPYVFFTIGDETVTTPTTLAAILETRLEKPVSPVIIETPVKAAEKNSKRYSSS